MTPIIFNEIISQSDRHTHGIDMHLPQQCPECAANCCNVCKPYGTLQTSINLKPEQGLPAQGLNYELGSRDDRSDFFCNDLPRIKVAEKCCH